MRMAGDVTGEYGPLISFVELFTVTQTAIRGGIVGASAEAGWARLSQFRQSTVFPA
jgi:hypothetical protein